MARPGSAIVEAVREILSLADFSRPSSVSGINRNQALFALRAKTAGVPAIDYYAAGKHHLVTHFRNCDRQLAPVEQVAAGGVPPAHVSPLIAAGVVLKEQVVLSVEVNQAVGIVRPGLQGRKVHLRTIALLIGGLRSADSEGDQE